MNLHIMVGSKVVSDAEIGDAFRSAHNQYNMGEFKDKGVDLGDIYRRNRGYEVVAGEDLLNNSLICQRLDAYVKKCECRFLVDRREGLTDTTVKSKTGCARIEYYNYLSDEVTITGDFIKVVLALRKRIDKKLNEGKKVSVEVLLS